MGSSNEESKIIQKAYNWHAKDVGVVLSELGTAREGLTSEEAERRQDANGKNQFTKKSAVTFFSTLVGQFKSPLVIVLLVAAFATVALHEYIDATVILLALFIAVAVGVVQEGRASRAFEKLRASQIHVAVVRRSGKKHEVSATELVPGDVVFVETGMQIPADLRLIEVKNLSINEAVLTGEWQSAHKQEALCEIGTPLAERASMAWKGTFVAEGHGVGVVVATGDSTEVGKIAEDLGNVEEVMTPLQWQMAEVSRTMFYFVLALVSVIFFIGIFRGESLETMLITSIAIAVASVPEGLPAAVTIILAIGMESLLRRGGLVRNLLAAETLGSTTYVLTDKTGTLTKARMAVTEIVCDGDDELVRISNLTEGAPRAAEVILNAALTASDAFVEEKKPEKEGEETYAIRGEPMERAILEAGLDMLLQGENARASRIDYLSFTSQNRIAIGLSDTEKGRRFFINGMPEYILESATSVHLRHGAEPMDSARRQRFVECLTALTKEGKRVIAVAYKDTELKQVPQNPNTVMEDGVVLLGLLVFHDPVRTDVKDAIEGVMHAGAVVRLVTGDNPETALSVAREVGIAREHDVALTGKDIAALTDDELYDVIQNTRVFARILPRQKLRLAQVLQKRGDIVAMTGDGVNDAPALQKANIGIALGSGTEIAKEAADLVLVNDSFKTIYAAIEEGRRIVSNLRKIVGYLLSTSLTEALLIGTALFIGAPIPLLPVQILWANIIEEGFMSVAFAFEPGDKRAMEQRPHDIHKDGILSPRMLAFIALVVCTLGIFLLSLYAYLLHLKLPIEIIRSSMFVMVSIDSLFIAFSFRSLNTPLWRISFFTNKFFVLSFLGSLLMLVGALMIPPLQKLLSYETLPPLYLGLALLYGLLSMLTIELGKWFFFEKTDKN